MKKYDRNKPLISIHIPKCAGTSFISVLKEWFNKNLYLHYFDEKSNKKPPRYKLQSGLFKRKYKEQVCIHGHFNKERGIGVSDYYPEIDQFITILRDPLQMILSNYYYGKKQQDKRFRDGKMLRIEDQYVDVNDYLKSSRCYLLKFMPFEMTQNNYKEIIDKYFIYIGIAEDLQTSVNVLADVLHFPQVKVDRLNTSEWNEQVSPEIKEVFLNNHKLEYAIYNYALDRYKHL